MVSIKKFEDNYYLCINPHHRGRGAATRKDNIKFWKNQFLIQEKENGSGRFSMSNINIHAPKELVGKRIMFPVTILSPTIKQKVDMIYEDGYKPRYEDETVTRKYIYSQLYTEIMEWAEERYKKGKMPRMANNKLTFPYCLEQYIDWLKTTDSRRNEQ